MLQGDGTSLLHRIAASAETRLIAGLERVGEDGSLWGLEKYEQLDPGWLEALTTWMRHRHDLAPFATSPRVLELPETATIAIAGDWGTGFWRADTGAERVRDRMRAEAADITVHLGDVYYAGTAGEEPGKFVELWPRGRLVSTTLNSNHEMYAGATGYYRVALASPVFAAQCGTSYFALQNRSWLIIGLDSAYHATGDLFMNGAIDAAQGAFLGRLSSQLAGRRVVVLSHHEGLSLRSGAPTALWHQVATALGRAPDYWYWGHAHNAVVFAPRDGCRGRCAGHGAIPYGRARMLAGRADVEWYETELAGDPRTPDRVRNGFVRLRLSGSGMEEAMLGEDGSIRWQGAPA
jgi:hypothetical protein